MDTIIPSIQTNVKRMKLWFVSIATIFTLVSFITYGATDNDSGSKATDNGSGDKGTDDGGERYLAYLKCINQVKTSDSGTG